MLLAAVYSYGILVPAWASESGNRAAAVLEEITENGDILQF